MQNKRNETLMKGDFLWFIIRKLTRNHHQKLTRDWRIYFLLEDTIFLRKKYLLCWKTPDWQHSRNSEISWPDLDVCVKWDLDLISWGQFCPQLHVWSCLWSQWGLHQLREEFHLWYLYQWFLFFTVRLTAVVKRE